MRKQIRQEYKSLAAIIVVIAAVASFWYLFPQVDNLGGISSREVDRILYKHLDDYKRAYSEEPRLATIFATAISDPDALTAADRQLLLATEKEFFSGWEVAWIYKDAGYFDNERFSLWDAWYAEEARRRPKFVWTENRDSFSVAFAEHVSRTIDDN